MAQDDPVPEYEKPTSTVLAREDVAEYLIVLSGTGISISIDRAADAYVMPSRGGEVRVTRNGDGWGVSRVSATGVLSTFGVATSVSALDSALRLANPDLAGGMQRNGRLSAATPASNYRTISRLVGSSTIIGVFDAYLDNGALVELCKILSFGQGTFARDVRLLGTTKSLEWGDDPTGIYTNVQPH
jgi:hypothetical protein